MFKIKFIFFLLFTSISQLKSFKINDKYVFNGPDSQGLSAEVLDFLKSQEFIEILKITDESGTPNLMLEGNLSILHLAVISEYLEDLFDGDINYNIFLYLLIHRGADYTLQFEQYGDTAIHAAIKRKNIAALRLFCIYCDLNILNRDGDTPLHLAIKQDKLDLVKMLTESGADLLIKNLEGLNAIELAKSLIFELESGYQIYDYLIEYYSDNYGLFSNDLFKCIIF